MVVEGVELWSDPWLLIKERERRQNNSDGRKSEISARDLPGTGGASNLSNCD